MINSIYMCIFAYTHTHVHKHHVVVALKGTCKALNHSSQTSNRTPAGEIYLLARAKYICIYMCTSLGQLLMAGVWLDCVFALGFLGWLAHHSTVKLLDWVRLPVHSGFPHRPKIKKNQVKKFVFMFSCKVKFALQSRCFALLLCCIFVCFSIILIFLLILRVLINT